MDGKTTERNECLKKLISFTAHNSLRRFHHHIGCGIPNVYRPGHGIPAICCADVSRYADFHMAVTSIQICTSYKR